MPTYDYECGACGHVFEVLQSMTDKKLTRCPKCEKNKLHRLIGGGSGLIFKGSGFYETDYKKKTPSVSSNSEPSSKGCGCGQPGNCSSSQ
jgi:putative FmdB family regulatory protein